MLLTNEPYFPKDLTEFDEMFDTEEACRNYLYWQRWPDGFSCPICAHDKGWTNNRNLIECQKCSHQTSLTAGTAMAGTRKPLKMWFRAMWWLCTQKTGISAAGLKRILGLKSMQTAWVWLQKLRSAMVRVDRDRLVSRVQIDEAFIGGESRSLKRKDSFKNARIAVAVEMHEDHDFGRIRIQDISRDPWKGIMKFIEENIEPGSIVEIDGWDGFDRLEKLGYRRSLVRAEDCPENPLHHVNRIVTMLKRWLLGTHQGRIGAKHLQGYLDEFVFRFNRRKSRHVGLLFQRIVKQSGETKAVSYRKLIASNDNQHE